MKKRINIMLSEEAVAVLDSQENKSLYIEELILGKREAPKPLTEERVLFLITRELENWAPKTVAKDVPFNIPGLTTADKLGEPEYTQFD